ncbi:MAG TPA: SoxR reducing system RseC family protein [Clostridia bacterium]|nr:SoxR reducing system RseC family protein [Clostridia bacterium]
MLEIGKITKLKKNSAVVSFDRKSACDSCHMCATTRGGMKVETLVPNALQANVGDYVEVEMGDKFVLTAAVIVYIIPLLLVGAGIGIGVLFSETVQIILAAAGLILGFVIAFLLDKVVKKKKGFSPQMVRIASESEIERKPMELPKIK